MAGTRDTIGIHWMGLCIFNVSLRDSLGITADSRLCKVQRSLMKYGIFWVTHNENIKWRICVTLACIFQGSYIGDRSRAVLVLWNQMSQESREYHQLQQTNNSLSSFQGEGTLFFFAKGHLNILTLFSSHQNYKHASDLLNFKSHFQFSILI